MDAMLCQSRSRRREGDRQLVAELAPHIRKGGGVPDLSGGNDT